ncbi:MAG: hypothetical protein QXO71_01750, partial [Candidatus Jordarchaeaceae archaeon]
GQNIITVSGDDLYSQEKVAEKFSHAKYDFEPIEKTANNWLETISKLRPMDMTALGPGLLGGYTLLKMRGGGRLLLLTDGLANTGFGTLESPSATGKSFYKEVAGSCNLGNIIVDVVGVRDESRESQLALNILGNLALETGGDIYYVTMEEIEATFADIRGKGYIARNVEVKMFTPPALKLVDATGTVSESLELEGSIRLGGVTSDREVYFEIKPVSEIKEEEVPIQAQIQYIDAEGRKHLRVISKKIMKAKNDEEYIKTYEPELAAAMRVQQAGRASYQGKGKKAQEIIVRYQKQISNAPIESSKLASVNNILNLELKELMLREKRSKDEAAVGSAKQLRKTKRELFKQ